MADFSVGTSVHLSSLKEVFFKLFRRQEYCNVTVICLDGRLEMNRLFLGLLFPQLTDEVVALLPSHSVGEVEALARGYIQAIGESRQSETNQAKWLDPHQFLELGCQNLEEASTENAENGGINLELKYSPVGDSANPQHLAAVSSPNLAVQHHRDDGTASSGRSNNRPATFCHYPAGAWSRQNPQRPALPCLAADVLTNSEHRQVLSNGQADSTTVDSPGHSRELGQRGWGPPSHHRPGSTDLITPARYSSSEAFQRVRRDPAHPANSRWPDSHDPAHPANSSWPDSHDPAHPAKSSWPRSRDPARFVQSDCWSGSRDPISPVDFWRAEEEEEEEEDHADDSEGCDLTVGSPAASVSGYLETPVASEGLQQLAEQLCVTRACRVLLPQLQLTRQQRLLTRRHSGRPSLPKTKVEKKRRKFRCNLCNSCRVKDCRKCAACRDMKKYGGPQRLKQACSQRPRCPFMSPKKTLARQPDEEWDDMDELLYD